MRIRYLLVGVGFGLLACLQYFWIAPELNRLSASYADEMFYDAVSGFRDSPTGAWSQSKLVARRVDQTLKVSHDVSIIQGDLHWTNASGVVEYESTGVYAVNRYTRANAPGLGNVERVGAFLMPLNAPPKNFTIWDQQFLGSRRARFVRHDELEGLKVHVFDFTLSNLDESEGYQHLADVPERFRAHTDGSGTLWVEPVSGVLLDYYERGSSYFVEPATGKRIAKIYEWTDRYTTATKAAHLARARQARIQVKAFELWLPLAFSLIGLTCLLLGVTGKKVAPEGNLKQ